MAAPARCTGSTCRRCRCQAIGFGSGLHPRTVLPKIGKKGTVTFLREYRFRKKVTVPFS